MYKFLTIFSCVIYLEKNDKKNGKKKRKKKDTNKLQNK